MMTLEVCYAEMGADYAEVLERLRDERLILNFLKGLAHGLFTEDGHAVFHFDLLRGAAAVAVVVHTVLYFAANAFQNLFVLHFYCLLKISSQNAAS